VIQFRTGRDLGLGAVLSDHTQHLAQPGSVCIIVARFGLGRITIGTGRLRRRWRVIVKPKR
jgi:hypothetical protein